MSLDPRTKTQTQSSEPRTQSSEPRTKTQTQDHKSSSYQGLDLTNYDVTEEEVTVINYDTAEVY